MLERRRIAGALAISVVLVCLLGSGALAANTDASGEAKASSSAPVERDFLAELEARDVKAPETKEPPVYLAALGFVSKLALVIGLAYLTILGLKRVTLIKAGPDGGRRSCRVVENLSLGANRQVHVVEIGARTLVLASTPSQISLITELAQDEVVSGDPADAVPGFGDHLSACLSAKPDADAAATNVAQALRDSGAFIREKASQIGKIRKRLRSGQDD